MVDEQAAIVAGLSDTQMALVQMGLVSCLLVAGLRHPCAGFACCSCCLQPDLVLPGATGAMLIDRDTMAAVEQLERKNTLAAELTCVRKNAVAASTQ